MRIVTLVLLATLACGEESRRLPNEDERATAESSDASSVQRPTRSDDSSSVAAGERAIVLIVGTSLTAGLGLDPEDAYPAVLQRKADSAGYRVDIVAAGVSGETSAGALRRIDWLLQRPADAIVIETGANDGLRGLDVDSTEANIREILKRAAAAKPSAKLFLMQMEAPPNLGQRYTTQFRGVFPTVARERAATLIPFLLDGVAAIPEMNQLDGIHPNIRGSQRVAENVWRTLAQALRSPSSGKLKSSPSG